MTPTRQEPPVTDTDSPTPRPGETDALWADALNEASGTSDFAGSVLGAAIKRAILARFAVTPRPTTDGPSRDEVCSCGNRFDGDNFCMVSACEQEGIDPTPTPPPPAGTEALREVIDGIERMWADLNAADERGEFGDKCDHDPCRVCSVMMDMQTAILRLRAATAQPGSAPADGEGP